MHRPLLPLQVKDFVGAGGTEQALGSRIRLIRRGCSPCPAQASRASSSPAVSRRAIVFFILLPPVLPTCLSYLKPNCSSIAIRSDSPHFFASSPTITQLCPIGKYILRISFSFQHFYVIIKASLTDLSMFHGAKLCPLWKGVNIVYENCFTFFFFFMPVHMSSFTAMPCHKCCNKG